MQRTMSTLLMLLLPVALFAATSPHEEDFESLGNGYAIANDADWTNSTGATVTTDATVVGTLTTYLGSGTSPLDGDHDTVLEVSENAELAVTTTASGRAIIEMLVRVVQSGAEPTGSGTDQFAIYVDDSGIVNVWQNDGGGADWLTLSNTPLADNAWVHLVVTAEYSTNRFKISVNGSELTHATSGFAEDSGATVNGPWFGMVQTNNALAAVSIDNDGEDSSYLDEITVANAAVVVADDAGGGNVSDDGAADTFDVVVSGSTMDVTVNGVLILDDAPVTTIVRLLGSNDDDSFNFDLGGNPMPNVVVDGQGEVTGDSMNFTNTTGTTLTYSPTNATDGSVDLDGNVVTFLNLEPIDVQGAGTANVVINDLTGGAQSITISSVGGGTQTEVDAGGGWEVITFTNPTTSLTINMDSGDDVVTTTHTALAALGAISLSFNGDGGNDTLVVDAEDTPAEHRSALNEIAGTGWLINYSSFESFTTNNFVTAVPALGQWGIVILALGLLILGVRRLPEAEGLTIGRSEVWAAAPVACFFGILAYGAWVAATSSMMLADLFCLPICLALTSYLVAFASALRERTMLVLR